MSIQFSKVYACYVWKQWEIWQQNCKMDTKKKKKTMQSMWILNRNDAWKKKLVKPKFLSQFQSVEQQVRLIKNLGKSVFWKTEHFNAETPQNTLYYEKKCMSMRWKVFQKYLNSTQIFQKQDFQSICPEISNFKHILY